MAYLPQDVVVDILSRLAVESLLRFKCVCKSWCALLESKEFIARHIVNQPLELITLSYANGNNTMSLLLSDSYHDNEGHSSCFMDFNHLDLKCPYLDQECWCLDFYGHCDGLVVVSDHRKNIIICNPAIRESRYLPKSTVFDQYLSENCLLADIAGIGLGYDYKSKDYKFVRIVGFWVDEYYSHELPSRVEVFSLGGDGDGSSWRELTNTTIEDSISFNRDFDNYLDGVLYWLASDKHLQNILYCFNMTDEVFQKVSTPDSYQGMEWGPKLGIFNKESMALFYFPSVGFEWKGVHIWVMKESGVEESWTRQLIIGPFMGFDLLLGQPLAFWKNDEQLLGQHKTSGLVSYDISTLECKKLAVHHKREHAHWQASSYRKTLVSVYANRKNTIGAV